MYNFLVTAKSDAWEKTCYEFDKSRFLEYTTEPVEKLFQTLTPDLIETLKGYPCLFAYEGNDNDFYIGNITEIKERGRVLFIVFTLDQNIPPIPFDKIKSIAAFLDIRDWEMSRTHWAVKDEDLFNRLIDANILNYNQIGEPGKLVKPSVKKSSNPTITTVQGFIAKVLASEKPYSTEIFYRGHSNKSKYKLEPSLFRKDGDGNYLDNEYIIYKELIISNSSDFQSDEYTLDRLVRMQHYSLPTRLLDITSNPLIALYFACKSAPNEDGEVIIFSMNRSEVKYFDSDISGCLANLVKLQKLEKDNISYDTKNFTDQVSIKKLMHFIREEKSYFEMNISPDDLRKIICVKGKRIIIVFYHNQEPLFYMD